MTNNIQLIKSLEEKILKLQIELADLKCIVLRQSVMIQNLIDDNRAMKKIIERKD